MLFYARVVFTILHFIVLYSTVLIKLAAQIYTTLNYAMIDYHSVIRLPLSNLKQPVISVVSILISSAYSNLAQSLFRIGTAAVLTGAVLAVTGGLAAPAIAGRILMI